MQEEEKELGTKLWRTFFVHPFVRRRANVLEDLLTEVLSVLLEIG